MRGFTLCSFVCGHSSEVRLGAHSGIEWCVLCNSYVAVMVTALDDDGAPIDLIDARAVPA